MRAPRWKLMICIGLERFFEPADWHRPESCKYGYFQIDTWPDSTSSLLMFEGMDLKCGVVN
jgi:hypothetical protein